VVINTFPATRVCNRSWRANSRYSLRCNRAEAEAVPLLGWQLPIKRVFYRDEEFILHSLCVDPDDGYALCVIEPEFYGILHDRLQQ